MYKTVCLGELEVVIPIVSLITQAQFDIHTISNQKGMDVESSTNQSEDGWFWERNKTKTIVVSVGILFDVLLLTKGIVDASKLYLQALLFRTLLIQSS